MAENNNEECQCQYKMAFVCKKIMLAMLGVVWNYVRIRFSSYLGGVPKWTTGADCKSVGDAFDGSNPSPTTI